MHYIPTEPELKHLGGNTIGGNTQTYFPELWFWLVQTLGVKTVLDVGCGEGHTLREFKRLGCETYGFDGLPRNVELARDAGAVVHDLTKGPYTAPAPIDLVWSCEVVGQICEPCVDNVLKTLAQGRYIAMTNEVPGQFDFGLVGHHHTNLQPTSYWEAGLARHGFMSAAKLTSASKAFGHHFWSATGAIYERIENAKL